MECSICHNPLPKGAFFCPHCGTKVEDSQTPTKRKTFLGSYLPWLLLLLALLLLLLYFFRFPKNGDETPSNVFVNEGVSPTERLLSSAKSFLNALKNKQTQKAYSDFASKNFKSNTSREQFDKFVEENPLLYQFIEAQVKAHEINQGRGLVTFVLKSEKEDAPVEFRLTQENGTWKVLLMRILYPTESKSTGGKLDALSIISTVQEYLEFLRNQKIEQAYLKFLGKDLRKEVTLDRFRQFIDNYPAFSSYDSLNIKNPYLEDSNGEIKIELQAGSEITEVTYVLQEENREWKIVGMHVEKVSHAGTDINQNVANVKMRDLIEAIQIFLRTLREQKVEEAYKNLTANHFREENSPSAFEEFLKKYPYLAESESATFEKLLFNNNIATFEVNLYINENEAQPIEFDLIQEKGKWKILNLFVHPIKKIDPTVKAKAPQVESSLEFSKAEFGTKIDENGQIENPTTVFKKGKEDIYVNIFVQHGVEGTPLDVVMRHVESGSSIPAIHAKVLETGESVISLVFSPPPKGWPIGNYQVRVSSENKVHKTFIFKVE